MSHNHIFRVVPHYETMGSTRWIASYTLIDPKTDRQYPNLRATDVKRKAVELSGFKRVRIELPDGSSFKGKK